jgi:RHH-type proline utilization regulon transcriptional repressor/proline dehydrogenase/delta 1-pyrroline-5-carboxylate dehydrogenase
MQAQGHRILRPAPAGDTAAGSFVAPALVEIDAVAALQREVFGPVLHLLRYRREDLDALLAQINATGYALTLGVHTRIDESVARVVGAARAGNLYVNRNIVGAVVGVQPFGGEGLSGTGPKAGGPLYLLRLLQTAPADAARRAVLRSGMPLGEAPLRGLRFGAMAGDGLAALQQWAAATGRDALAQACAHFAETTPMAGARVLPGPTGESNLYTLQPRDAVLCLADAEADGLVQLAAVLAVGGPALWPAAHAARRAALPEAVQARVRLVQDWTRAEVHFDAVLLHGDAVRRREVATRLAQRPGPIVLLHAYDAGDTAMALERLVIERSLSVNTAAAGGNASLMTIG